MTATTYHLWYMYIVLIIKIILVFFNLLYMNTSQKSNNQYLLFKLTFSSCPYSPPPPPPHGRLLQTLKGMGVSKVNHLKERQYEAKLEFPEEWSSGGGFKAKDLPWGEGGRGGRSASPFNISWNNTMKVIGVAFCFNRCGIQRVIKHGINIWESVDQFSDLFSYLVCAVLEAHRLNLDHRRRKFSTVREIERQNLLIQTKQRYLTC